MEPRLNFGESDFPCPHKPPDGAKQVRPGLWTHGDDVWVFEDEFLTPTGILYAAAHYRLALKAGVPREPAFMMNNRALSLAVYQALKDVGIWVSGTGTMYICHHGCPEGVKR